MRMVVGVKHSINIWSQAWSQNQSIASYNIVYMARTITMLHTLSLPYYITYYLLVLLLVSVRQQYLPELIINLKKHNYEVSI
jgi:hypothetical protein